MDSLHFFETVIGMMVAIIALHYVAGRIGLPPSVALILGGAAITLIPGLPVIAIDPGLVLVLFLPPLLMDGAWFIPLAHLRRNLVGILSLAIGAVVFTTVVVAVVTRWLLPDLPWVVCAALGAIVSPPDAISARAVLQRVKLPPRLSMLLEGESLLNDATGLVLFRFAIAAAATGAVSGGDAVLSFAGLAVGGTLVGAAIGGAWVLLVRRLRDDSLMIAASVLVGWVAYIAGERLQVSGVFATVAAGLVCGWYQHVVFPARVRLRGGSFWTVLVFLLEAMVFLLIGSSLRGVIERAGGLSVVLDTMLIPALGVLLALTAARFIWVYGSDVVIRLQRVLGWRRFEPLGLRGATVLGWAGMRGVVTLAVALSIPATLPGRDFVLVTAFVVIIGTVLVQGTTFAAVIRWARLDGRDPHAAPLNRAQAEVAMAKAKLRHVESRAHDTDGTLIHPQLLERYRRIATITASYAEDEERHEPRLQAHFDVVLAAVAAGRAELLRLHRAGRIDDATLHELERDLDLEELAAQAAKD